MAILCPNCNGLSKVKDTWTFSQYVARHCVCTVCKEAFETNEKVQGYNPALDHALRVQPAEMAMPADWNAQDEEGTDEP